MTVKMLDNWLPPESAGAPVACLATTFTFDAEFFASDCITRFLSISTGDTDGTASLEGADGLVKPDVIGILEEEEKLADAPICVLVDQSYQPDDRNLRWDLLPVRVPGGLLHAKVTILIWERFCRVLISSANLTPAGYRSQVEIVMPLDLVEETVVPRSVFAELSAELRSIASLVAGDQAALGPKRRAFEILDLFDQRIAVIGPPESQPRGFRISLAPSRRGTNPIDRITDVWSGTKPTDLTALSPFWDDTDEMPGVRALLAPLPTRGTNASSRAVDFVVPVDTLSVTRTVRAPKRLLEVAGGTASTRVLAFAGPDDRRLHAKCALYESGDWVAALFGSSNFTAKGLGIDSAPHREINLWLGVPSSSREAKGLKELVKAVGDEVSSELDWENAVDDEDESTGVLLPEGFLAATLTGTREVTLSFDPAKLPTDWTITMRRPAGDQDIEVYSSLAWAANGGNEVDAVELADSGGWLPRFLSVGWQVGGERRTSYLIVNVLDKSLLPPPEEMKALSLEDLLQLVASSRPLRNTYAEIVRRAEKDTASDGSVIDPLKAFNSSGMLLQRIRRRSASLAGVERRLKQPLRSLEALDWRLRGTLGVETLATRLVEEAVENESLPGETLFFLAELALAVGRIQWRDFVSGDLLVEVEERVQMTLELLRSQATSLETASTDPAIISYVDRAFAEAMS